MNFPRIVLDDLKIDANLLLSGKESYFLHYANNWILCVRRPQRGIVVVRNVIQFKEKQGVAGLLHK